MGLIRDPDAAAPFACDASRKGGVIPPLVIRPVDTAGVSEALRLCHAHGQPVAVQGGLTGLSGGARVQPGEIALSLHRLARLGTPDLTTNLIEAEAGVPLQRVQEAAQEAGLYFGVDLGARGTAMVGGCISTNAGGIRVIRYGMFRAQVAGLTAVLADGTIIRAMGGLAKDNAGMDLAQMFIGTEGTHGVVTEALLRLHPAPTLQRSAFCAVVGPEAAMELLPYLRTGLGNTLSAFEGIWPDVYAGAAAHCGVHPLPEGAGLYILVEIQGVAATLKDDILETILMGALEAGLCTDVVVAGSGREHDGLWRLRDACPEFTFSLGSLVPHDVSLPLTRLADFVTQAKVRVREIDTSAEIMIYGHLGDGNLHYLVRTETREAVSAAVNRLAAEMGGSITAEHGVGIDKAPYLPLVRSPAELELMRTLAKTLDPVGILNPGRIFDAPSRRPNCHGQGS